MRKIFSIAAAFVAAVVLISGAQVSAQNTSAGLGITPRKDVTILPGKSVTDRLQVSNLDTQKQLKLTLRIVDFGAQDETGTPSLRLQDDAPQTAWSLKPFIKVPATLTVAPGKTEYINYTVTIPADQGAGSYYSAIRYVAEGNDSGQVAVTASGATLVFVTVPGKTKESLIVQKFGAYESKSTDLEGKFRSVFVKDQPKKLAFTVKNQGNVAEQPAGSIQIKNMFGKQVKIIKDANPKGSLALIGQTRRFEVCIKDLSKDDDTGECKPAGLAPGRYTAALSAFYGINGNQTQDVAASTSFWYLPVWFLVVVAAALGAVSLGGFTIYRRFTGKGSFRRR